MVAMRECIGGMYGDTYWREMGILTVFFAASLLLGLFFRAPVIRANQKFVQKLEETGVI
jgi:putative membrane protein